MKVINKLTVPATEIHINSRSFAQGTNVNIELGQTMQPISPITLENTYEVLGVIWQHQYVHYVLKSDLAIQSDSTTWLCIARTNLFELIDNTIPAEWALMYNKVGIYDLWTLSHSSLSPITQIYDRLQNKETFAQLLIKPFIFNN
jgi:hypothetical protein